MQNDEAVILNKFQDQSEYLALKNEVDLRARLTVIEEKLKKLSDNQITSDLIYIPTKEEIKRFK